MRGARSATIRDEARICAERMGYHWLENTDLALPFDGLMYRTAAVAALILKKVRYVLRDYCIFEKNSRMKYIPSGNFPFRRMCSASSG